VNLNLTFPIPIKPFPTAPISVTVSLLEPLPFSVPPLPLTAPPLSMKVGKKDSFEILNEVDVKNE
jgi:hypothetical protein